MFEQMLVSKQKRKNSCLKKVVVLQHFLYSFIQSLNNCETENICGVLPCTYCKGKEDSFISFYPLNLTSALNTLVSKNINNIFLCLLRF